MPNTNLGQGRGPFPPQAFFLPAVPLVSPGLEDEQDGGFFGGVQRQVALAAVAIAVASSAVSAQAIGGQFEEMPKAIASPGVQQQLVISPSAKEPARLRHFYATEEIPTAAATFVSDENTWAIQLPAPGVAVPQAFSGPEEFSAIVGNDEGWLPPITAAPDALRLVTGIEEAPPQAAATIVEDEGWRAPGPTDRDVLLPAPWIDGGDSMQWAAIDESSYELPRQIAEPSAVQPFLVSAEIVAQPPASISVDDTPDPLSCAQTTTPALAQPFSTTEERFEPINVDDAPRVLSLAFAQTSVEVPAPAFVDTEERVLALVINADDVPQPVYDRQTFVAPASPQLFAEPEVEIPPPSIRVDDVPQPTYDRQTFVAPPVPQLFGEAELEITPLTIDRAIAQNAGAMTLGGNSQSVAIESGIDATVSPTGNSQSISLLSGLNATISINSTE